jgi:hypothetical protein
MDLKDLLENVSGQLAELRSAGSLPERGEAANTF